ncbi:hypothetical protein B0A48_06364 [Cryoendolithus antarcticus]|uniref:DUF7730 domain-containing protein n=1 Tax=Cryoendolithus antarcticus TaxID=1507870 RepID=A0A1V8TB38_9PEZI|nr:hypothetical protein B0A48_06364 [Cryoendolithus antarcticus]
MAQTRCHLFNLPPELRLRIYELLFQPQICYLKVARAVYTRRESIKPDGVRRAPLPEPMHLSRTCRLIYNEALPVFYKHAIFDIEIRKKDYSKVNSQIRSIYLRIPPDFDRGFKRVPGFQLLSTQLQNLGESLIR